MQSRFTPCGVGSYIKFFKSLGEDDMGKGENVADGSRNVTDDCRERCCCNGRGGGGSEVNDVACGTTSKEGGASSTVGVGAICSSDPKLDEPRSPWLLVSPRVLSLLPFSRALSDRFEEEEDDDDDDEDVDRVFVLVAAADATVIISGLICVIIDDDEFDARSCFAIARLSNRER